MTPNLDTPEGLTAAAKAHWNEMSTAHKKVVLALRTTVDQFITLHGLNHVLFGTLTLENDEDGAPSIARASKAFRSLSTNVLNRKSRYKGWIRVLERGDTTGRVHYHVLLAVEADIRTGTNWDEWNRRNYRSANRKLKALWRWWRKNAGKYGFGRCNFQPIKSCSDVMGKYISKYVSAHINQRRKEDKGARLVAYSKHGVPASSCRFQFHSIGSELSRKKLSYLAVALGFSKDNYTRRMQMNFGKKWMYRLGPIIKSIKLPSYDNYEYLARDYPQITVDGNPIALDDLCLWTDVAITDRQLVKHHHDSLRDAVHYASLLFTRRNHRNYLRQHGEEKHPLPKVPLDKPAVSSLPSEVILLCLVGPLLPQPYLRHLRKECDARNWLPRGHDQEGRGVLPPQELFTLSGPVWPD